MDETPSLMELIFGKPMFGSSSVDWILVTCVDCGISFGLRKEFYEMTVQTKRVFSCPNGHSLRFKPRKEEEKE